MAGPRDLRFSIRAKNATAAAFRAVIKSVLRTAKSFSFLSRAAVGTGNVIGRAFRGAGVVVGRFAARVAATGAAMRKVGDVVSSASDLEGLAASFGTTADQVDIMGQAFRQAGRDPADMVGMLETLADAIIRANDGDPEALAALNAFDVDTQSLNTLKQLEKVMANIQKLGIDPQRMKLLGRIFGGGAPIGALRQVTSRVPNLQEFGRDLQSQGQVVDAEKNRAAAESFNTTLRTASGVMSQAINAAADSGLTNKVTAAANVVGSTDLNEAANAIGNSKRLERLTKDVSKNILKVETAVRAIKPTGLGT